MKKIIILVLIVLLVINPVGVYATSTAAAIEVAGSVASGGLAGGYSKRTETSALAITMALMYGLGWSVHLSQEALNAGQTAADFIKNLYAKWVGGTSAEDLTGDQYEELKRRFSIVANGNNGEGENNDSNKVDKDGKIFITPGALDFINKFFNWLKSNGYIGSGNVTETVNGTLFNYRVLSSALNNEGYPYGCLTSDKQPVAWVKMKAERDPADTNYYICSYRPTIFDYYNVGKGPLDLETDNFMGPHTSSGALTYGNYYYTYDYFGTADLPENVIDITALYGFGYGQNGMKAYLAMLDGFEVESTSNESYIEGDYNQDDLNNADSKYTLIDPKFIEQLQNSLAENIHAQISIADYLRALMDQFNKQVNPQYVPNPENVPAVNLPTLEPIIIPIPDPIVVPVEVNLPKDSSGEENDPPDDADPVNDPDPAPPDVSVPQMMIPLDEYFPFCIPFDVYHLLQKLSADPVAPSYTIGFTVYGTRVNYTISLDAFSSAMVIVRKMELFVCVVGLAIASRKIFTR